MPRNASFCCGVYYHNSHEAVEQKNTTPTMNGAKTTDGKRIDEDGGELLDCLGKPQSGRNLQTLQPTPANFHHSAGITYANQDQLPRLPIPHLFETLTKFQARLEALQDEAQRAETAEIVREFLENEGPILQEHLYEYEEEGTRNHEIGSYVEEFWNESYLSPDSSVVLNLNPYFVLEDAPDPKIAKDQIRRAASLCFAALKMASLLKHEALPPDTFKGRALCMDQFKALFGSSRQPNVRGVSDDVHVYNDSIHGKCHNRTFVRDDG
jgi:carnitine O-acetyltransferase